MAMNRLSRDRRIAIVAALVEGNSIASTCRMNGVAKNTVLKLLADMGFACFDYSDRTIRDIETRRIECDEIWAFVGSKAKNVPAEKRGMFGAGDVWTWCALDSDTKLMVSWMVGTRDAGAASVFMQDVASRLACRVQLTTDGHKPYLQAVEDAFGGDIDYAMLVKQYGKDPANETRYSPAICTGAKREVIVGDPEWERINTSYIERANLTTRMSVRRFTRLTNGFSKKVENLEHAVSLHFAHYNFCRTHKSLRGQTPAMAAGLADHVWTIGELVDLIELEADFVIG